MTEYKLDELIIKTETNRIKWTSENSKTYYAVRNNIQISIQKVSADPETIVFRILKVDLNKTIHTKTINNLQEGFEEFKYLYNAILNNMSSSVEDELKNFLNGIE